MKRRDFVRTAAVAGASVMLPWDLRAAPPVAQLDERAPKFRIRGSAPPQAREPFRHG